MPYYLVKSDYEPVEFAHKMWLDTHHPALVIASGERLNCEPVTVSCDGTALCDIGITFAKLHTSFLVDDSYRVLGPEE